MNLQEIIQSNITCRYYRPDPVPDDVLTRVLSAARFAPSGGNRQPVRFIVIRDSEKKRSLRDLYLPYWEEYLKGLGVGNIRAEGGRNMLGAADHFARHIDAIPLLIMVCAQLADVHPTDDKLGRLSVVGGASIYPAVQNLLLTCREEGLGSALTTLLCHEEPAIKRLLEIPEDISVCATLMVGFPEKPFPKKLSRRPVREIAYLDRYGDAFPTVGEAD